MIKYKWVIDYINKYFIYLIALRDTKHYLMVNWSKVENGFSVKQKEIFRNKQQKKNEIVEPEYL